MIDLHMRGGESYAYIKDMICDPANLHTQTKAKILNHHPSRA